MTIAAESNILLVRIGITPHFDLTAILFKQILKHKNRFSFGNFEKWRHLIFGTHYSTLTITEKKV